MLFSRRGGHSQFKRQRDKAETYLKLRIGSLRDSTAIGPRKRNATQRKRKRNATQRNANATQRKATLVQNVRLKNELVCDERLKTVLSKADIVFIQACLLFNPPKNQNGFFFSLLTNKQENVNMLGRPLCHINGFQRSLLR